MKKKKYLITSALPYANGPLHFGHLAGAYIPADIIVRHKRLHDHETLFICGSDEHGVAIMLNANKQKKPYKEYVDAWHLEHLELMNKYEIEFSYFGQTSTEYHAEETKRWFLELYEKGLVGTKDNQQLFCNDCKNHLPDRFVTGTCYQCGYTEARGDECPNCGIWVEPAKLKNPVCQICKSTNIEEVTVTQYYLLLSKYHQEFRKWFETKESSWRKTVWPYVDSLTKEELVDRAISRDLDWGIDVPLAEACGKKLYVWFDAPIGYVSNTKKYLEEIKSNEHYLLDWWKNKDTEILHFIGKDNIIFHTIIFPIMGMATGFINPPTDVPANQYVNLLGKQFSKSSGWYVDAKDALDKFGSTALRYYLISLIPETSDSSFVWENFKLKVNGELANNIGNLVNRAMKFYKKNWPEGLSAKYFSGFSSSDYGKKLQEKLKEHNTFLDEIQIRKGLDLVMSIGHDANNYFSEKQPWASVKTDMDEAQRTIAWSAQYILTLGVLFSPYLPLLSKNILDLFHSVLDETDIKKLYGGDIKILDDIFKNGMKLDKDPVALVPKIDDEVIKNLEAQLLEKSV
ncbi:MAG: methionine--tRNA ligase [Bdellovibrionales bacterium RIFOXYA1_FULL_36_14]|nr:MAG: methionine--tRNA ligase [Bdellovibrionales bacterium RIFOXYA1_FULL_36_14]